MKRAPVLWGNLQLTSLLTAETWHIHSFLKTCLLIHTTRCWLCLYHRVSNSNWSSVIRSHDANSVTATLTRLPVRQESLRAVCVHSQCQGLKRKSCIQDDVSSHQVNVMCRSLAGLFCKPNNLSFVWGVSVNRSQVSLNKLQEDFLSLQHFQNGFLAHSASAVCTETRIAMETYEATLGTEPFVGARWWHEPHKMAASQVGVVKFSHCLPITDEWIPNRTSFFHPRTENQKICPPCF